MGRLERGLEVSLVSVVDFAARRAFALDARQRLPAENEGTAIDTALTHLTKTKPDWPERVKLGVFDGWYARTIFVDGIVKFELNMIGKLRWDANLRYLFVGPYENRRRLFRGKVNLTDQVGLQRLGELALDVAWFTGIVHHVAFNRLVQLVLVIDRSNPASRNDTCFSQPTPRLPPTW